MAVDMAAAMLRKSLQICRCRRSTTCTVEVIIPCSGGSHISHMLHSIVDAPTFCRRF